MYQPYQPTYQQPYQYGQTQPVQLRPALSGKPVATLAEVGVGDVPTDGTRGWFPAHDGSCVWAKQWSANGAIETVRYVPERTEPPEPEPDRIDAIIARLDAIEAALKPKRKGAKDDQAD